MGRSLKTILCCRSSDSRGNGWRTNFGENIYSLSVNNIYISHKSALVNYSMQVRLFDWSAFHFLFSSEVDKMLQQLWRTCLIYQWCNMFHIIMFIFPTIYLCCFMLWIQTCMNVFLNKDLCNKQGRCILFIFKLYITQILELN